MAWHGSSASGIAYLARSPLQWTVCYAASRLDFNINSNSIGLGVGREPDGREHDAARSSYEDCGSFINPLKPALCPWVIAQCIAAGRWLKTSTGVFGLMNQKVATSIPR
jgi:hypothetical protein